MTTRSVVFGLVCGGIGYLLPLLALAGTAPLPISAADRRQQGKPADTNQNWGQATFHGLVVGKSTSADVIREFGKPKWRGGVKELVVPSDREGETQYQYSAPSDVNGDVLE